MRTRIAPLASCAALVLGALVFGLSSLGSRAAAAVLATSRTNHPGASVWGEMTIEPTKLLFRIEGAADPFRTNLKLPFLPIGPLEEDQVAANRAAIERFIHEDLRVVFDGVEIEPTLTFVYVQDGKPEEMSWRSTRIDLEYPYATEPQKITLIWPSFEGEGVTYVPVVIKRGAKGIPRQFQVLPEEPEYTWHADSVRPRIAGEMKKFNAPKKTIDLPVISLAALALAAASLIFSRKLDGALWKTMFVGSVVAAVLLKPYGVVPVRSSFLRAAPLPAESQARAIFATLNANVYRAFEAESESAIYDTLADSAAGELLDDLYGQIYESLILREQGGPICSVESVEDLGGSIDLTTHVDSDPPQFGVDWHWRVLGAVSHYGHIHRRMNEYKADFVVRHDGETWKIAVVKVKHHERIDDFE